MNNDRELLELAAKAAGYDYECTAHTGYPEHDQHQIRSEFGTLVDWNPLTDDGDALRLATKLLIGLTFYCYKTADEMEVRVKAQHMDHETTEFAPHNDYEEATRRAIVRAAAEIGKEQK